MYYGKATSGNVAIPKNYGGNAFRPILDEDANENDTQPPESREEKSIEKENEPQNDFLSAFLSGISAEDVLLIGLIFIIHQENPNDSILLLLLILLLTK